jgi:5-methylcytosine-specific restriction endonuclease McrA
MSLLDKPIVLKLNRVWVAIHIESPKTSFTDLGNGKIKALDIVYPQKESGEYDFANPISITPCAWDQWIELPVRPYDDIIHTIHKSIRVPTVVVCTNYSHMPVRLIKFSKSGVYERDNGTCQYTGEKLKRSESTVDHVLPLSRGGRNSWDNVALTSKKVNFAKGNKLNEEAGLKLLRRPKEPNPVPVSLMLKNVGDIPEWSLFLKYEHK